MSSVHKNLSEFSTDGLLDMSAKRLAIVVAEWNEQITGALFDGAYKTLLQAGVQVENILRYDVPGSFELSVGAQWAAQRTDVDAVICLGCVIQGETRHFDFICQAVAYGVTEVGLKYNKPVIFGVLTPDNQQQALDRAGGKHGNKGDEAAITAVKMLGMKAAVEASAAPQV